MKKSSGYKVKRKGKALFRGQMRIIEKKSERESEIRIGDNCFLCVI